MQAALPLRLLNILLGSIHLFTHINHKALEKMSRSLMITQNGRRRKKQSLSEAVEADGATIDQRSLTPQEVDAGDGKSGVGAVERPGPEG